MTPEQQQSSEDTAPGVAANAPTRSLVGQTIGQYELLRELGRGGMGTVYLALDTKLGRQVALKLLTRQFSDDAARVRRFRQEARAISTLNHPNILTIHEIGETQTDAGTLHFLATEYVEGQTLRAVLGSDDLTLGALLDIAIQASGALAAAHQAGIVHRDLKPENIMVRPDGLVKVLDFGLAKLTNTNPAAPATFSTVDTKPGVLMGTISYMSPEQARGLDVDARSDLFSFGVVLYELLTGRAPFAGATTGDVLVSILEREPPALRQQAPQVPAALQGIINRALAKDREQRYQHASELLGELKELKQQLELAARLKQPGDTPAQAVSLSLRVGQALPDEARASFSTKAGGRVSGSKAAPAWQRVVKPAAAVAVVFALCLLGWWGRNQWLNPQNKPLTTLAVLPFVNVGNDPQMEYLVDGLTEDLNNSLAQLPGLRVMARGTVFSYKGREVDPRQVGRELGAQVQAVVTGRVQRQGERLSISAELADTTTGAQLWTELYPRPYADLPKVQGEIVREIAAKLQHQLSPASQQQLAKRQPAASQAYEPYQQGRFLYLQYSRASQQKALDYFRQAVALDPQYALAYCGIADVYADFSSQSMLAREAMPQARQAALKAIELDEQLPEAHHSLALVKLWGNWDWAGAEREFKRALELNPSLSLSRMYYAEMLSHQKRFAEALREIKLVEQSDPVSIQAMAREANIYFLSRQYDQAMAVFRKILDLAPNNKGMQRQMVLVLSQQGRHEEAIALVNKLQTPTPSQAQLMCQVYAYGRAGQRADALKALTVLKAQAEQEPVPQLYLADAYLALGDRVQALACVQKNYEAHSDHLKRIGTDPIFDPLRDDPRFLAILRGIGLQP